MAILDQAIAVIDVGKTRTKLSLWSEGKVIGQADRTNAPILKHRVAQLDIEAGRAWLLGALADAARCAEVTAIVPVAHGAAAVLTDAEQAVAALDYEAEPPADVRSGYERERDPFDATLSPRLPAGLNLGVQLFWLERLFPELWPGRGRALLWPQFWAHALCGGRAAEVSSLGCHSDLWRPGEGRWSRLAERRGWAERLGPLRGAAEPLGAVSGAIAAATGLPERCQVYCGLHDSNAALHAARAHVELGARFSVVSTGTWFVTLSTADLASVRFNPREDMLANVDIDGRPTPTARFMGGRDYEAWMGSELGAAAQLACVDEALRLDGPEAAASAPVRATWAALELARRTHHSLGLVAAAGPILIEGRFAGDEVFASALAALRLGQPVFRSTISDGVTCGAARLAAPGAFRPPPLVPVPPLDSDLSHARTQAGADPE